MGRPPAILAELTAALARIDALDVSSRSELLEALRERSSPEAIRLRALLTPPLALPQPTPRREKTIARSPAMRELLTLLDRVRLSDAPVLIQGESGSGKEQIARLIHEESARAGASLLGINCAALPEPLLESELFGHVEGAFTGASRRRPGLFASADGGTLFLDELGEMPLAMQAKLLRVVEDGLVFPVGADEPIKVDVRILAASHRDLERLVGAGRLRADLFYRLAVIRVEVPPLRHRREDLPELVALLIARGRHGRASVRGVAPAAMRLFERYDWPGNVRELEATLHLASLFAERDRIELEDLARKPELFAPRIVPAAPATAPKTEPLRAPPVSFELARLERWAIEQALEATGGNKAEAARRLGLSRVTLHRKLARYASGDRRGGR